MTKKVIFNGIEIFANEDEQSAKSLLSLVENIITRLESNLDSTDENFNISIDTVFSPNAATKHHVTINGTANRKIKDKVFKILRKSTESKNGKITGTLKVDLQIQDG